MDTFMSNIREIFTGTEEGYKADVGGSRDQKIPTQKTQSFKEKKKAPNWFQRQLSRKMSHDYDSIEHVTAIAAAAFAINSQDVSEIPEEKKRIKHREISLTKTKSKVDGTKSPFSLPGAPSKTLSGSFKSRSDQGDKLPISSVTEEKKPEKAITPKTSMKKASTFSEKMNNTGDVKKPEIPAPKRAPTFGDDNLMNTDHIRPETPEPKVPPPVHHPEPLRPPPLPPSPPPPPPPLRQPSRRPSINETKAEAWERNQLQKIKERYEKLMETIDSWEDRKKIKARRKLNKHMQHEDERKRVKALKKYEGKMKYIDEIAGGAREEAFARRRKEEHKAKEKANIIRTTGELPRTCSCF